MRSLIYWHPAIYAFFIRLSYRNGYAKRYEAVKGLIEEGGSVVDVCCGDCEIADFLKDKKVDYTGLDFNSHFVRAAKRRGIKSKIFNIYEDEVPKADYVLIQGSLYQFIPRHAEILNKLYDAAGKFLIISEPIRSNAESKSRLVSFLAYFLNNPGDGTKRRRFDIGSLKEALVPFKDRIVKEFLADNGVDYIAVIKKN